MRGSKYPSLGILDEIFKAFLGFHPNPSKNGLYEVLPPQQRPSKVNYAKILHQLDRNGYIQRKNNSLYITKKGKKKASIRKIQQISLPKKMDGNYRIIAFDIPEKMRHARDIIRSKLKVFQCTKIQKSLYMTPHVCEKEIREISRILKIEKHVTVLKLDRNFAKLNDREK